MKNAQLNYVQKLLAKVRQRQLVLARAGRVRESSQFARWAARVRRVADGFDSGDSAQGSTGKSPDAMRAPCAC